ncbi:F-box protein SKIP2-like protein [Tanacetum coccineum]
MLKKFTCSECNFGAKGIIVLLHHCSSLEELSVKYLHSGHLFEPLIIGSNNLKTLKLNTLLGNWDRSLEMIAVSDKSLVDVHLEYFDVSDIGLLALSKCSNLQALHLHCLPHCTNAVLISVAENCKGLKKLYIEDWNNSEIGDEGLIAVGKHSANLQELSLIGVNASCVSLEVIATNCKKLVRIVLSRSETISDVEMSCIAEKCVALKFLCIEECGVSNKGIEALVLGCPNLANLKVTKCRKVTREVGDLLRAKRGSLVVKLEPPVIRAYRGCFTGNNRCGVTGRERVSTSSTSSRNGDPSSNFKESS